MESKLVIPQIEDQHPATSVMVDYLNKISAKKLQDWETIFSRYHEKNKLADRCLKALVGIREGEMVYEVDLMGLAWMLIRMELDEEKKKLEILKTESKKMAVNLQVNK